MNKFAEFVGHVVVILPICLLVSWILVEVLAK